MRFLSRCLTTAAALAMLTAHVISTPALAQDNYPSRVVRVIVPYTPGGITDVLARVVAEGLSQIARAAVHRREPARRRHLDRYPRGRDLPAGRLHAADGHHRAQHQHTS